MSQDSIDSTINSTCKVHLEAVDRISKLPVVESSVKVTTSVYKRIKDINCLTHWTFNKAENTFHIALNISKPIATTVASRLEKPIKKFDEILCTGLDYAEDKIPAVKSTPGELYTGAKVLVCNTMKCAVKLGKNVVKLNIKIARKFTDPIVETAKDCAHHLFDELEEHVEPSVLNAMDPRDPTEVEENPPRPPAPEPVCEERVLTAPNVCNSNEESFGEILPDAPDEELVNEEREAELKPECDKERGYEETIQEESFQECDK